MEEKVIMRKFGIQGDQGMPVNLDKSTQGIQNLLKYDEIDSVMDFYGVERVMKYKQSDGNTVAVLWKESPKFIKRICLIEGIRKDHKDIMVNFFISNGEISSESDFDELYDKMESKRNEYKNLIQYSQYKEDVEKIISENKKIKDPLKEEFDEFKKDVDNKFDAILGLLQTRKNKPKISKE